MREVQWGVDSVKSTVTVLVHVLGSQGLKIVSMWYMVCLAAHTLLYSNKIRSLLKM